MKQIRVSSGQIETERERVEEREGEGVREGEGELSLAAAQAYLCHTCRAVLAKLMERDPEANNLDLPGGGAVKEGGGKQMLLTFRGLFKVGRAQKAK